MEKGEIEEARPKGAAGGERSGGPLETVRALLLAIAVALAIRAFVVEPFKIPSGSMIPTLLVGDYVLVNKSSYGVRLPFTGSLVFALGKPERGDVIVFRYPDDPSQDFIKRIVGMPGDRIEMRENRVFLNGQPIDLAFESSWTYRDLQRSSDVTAQRFIERNPEGVEYTVLYSDSGYPSPDRGPWIVPEGSYFAMGDNRDNSSDSRMWRNHFVRDDQIKGRAFLIHWSWVVASGPSADRGFLLDLLHTLYRVVTFQVEEVRWSRIGRPIDGLAD